MLQDDYQVSLEAFKGPLDLLLFLIRRNEVDVHDIPIAAITEQYLAFLKQIDHVDIELAGEFLVMAATLIEIKSRTIAPKPEGQEDAQDQTSAVETGDPRYELVQQLLAYQRYRIASEELEHRRAAFAQRFAASVAKPPAAGDQPRELELEDAHVLDLSEAYERIVSSIDFSRLGAHTVEVDDTPVQLHQEDLLDQLGRAPGHRVTLQETFTGRTRLQVIGLFLAMLELVRQRRVIVMQDRIHGEIAIELNEDPDLAMIETMPRPEDVEVQPVIVADMEDETEAD
jgi:segregation and condensation protein A